MSTCGCVESFIIDVMISDYTFIISLLYLSHIPTYHAPHPSLKLLPPSFTLLPYLSTLLPLPSPPYSRLSAT